MKLVYLGSEVPSNRKLLLDCGVRAVGFSYLRALKRGFPKTKAFSFDDYYPEDCLIAVHPGITEVTKYAASELEALAADYQDFVVTHIDRLDGFVEFDAPSLGPAWRTQQRRFFEEAGPKFWPVWTSEQGMASLQELAARFPEVAIPGETIESETALAGQARGLSGIYETTWHALAVSRPDNLRQIPFATASTLSWASPMMRGETIVWDGTQLKRYQKKQKDQARPRYKAIIEQAGLDYEAILADDAKEVTRLAIWSYQQLEMNVDKKRPPLRVVNPEEPTSELITGMSGAEQIVEMLSGAVDNSPVPVGNSRGRVPAPREAVERLTLPVLGVTTKTTIETDEEGRPTIKEVPVVHSKGTSLRQCNTCFVAANCPAFKPDSECAFSLPVEVKTKDQLVGLLQAIIEMQGARVAFARYAEELNGGYPDPNTSQEMDRLFKLVTQLKELEDNKEFVRMTFERQGGAGVLSAIFGDRAAQLRELDGGGYSEPQTTRIIQQSIED